MLGEKKSILSPEHLHLWFQGSISPNSSWWGLGRKGEFQEKEKRENVKFEKKGEVGRRKKALGGWVGRNLWFRNKLLPDVIVQKSENQDKENHRKSNTERCYLSSPVWQKGSLSAAIPAVSLVWGHAQNEGLYENAFSQESQLLLWTFVPSSAMQSEPKFMATTSLKFAIFSSFFQDARSVILLPNAFEKGVCFGHAD